MKDGNRIVALCTSRICDKQIQRFIEIVNEGLKAHGARLWVYAINSDIYWEEDNIPAEAHVFDVIHYDWVDALILMDEKIKSHTVSKKIIAAASERDIPVVVVDGEYEGTVNISYDYAAGFEQVVRHVICDHGVKTAHFIAGFKDNRFSEERLSMFKKVLSEQGLPFDDTMVSYGEFWAIPARAAAKKLIDEERVPEAVICANDIMAINVCDVLKKAGYKIPGDVKVSGFDGYDETLLARPGVTTAACTADGLAPTVCTAVLECFEGKKTGSYKVLPRLMKNESCGCERNVSADVTQMDSFNNSFYRYQDDVRKYQGIAIGMQSSTIREDMMKCLHSYFTRNMCCIVDGDCFRNDINFFMEKEHSGEYKILFDSLHYSDYPDPFDPADVVPEYEERMAGGYPLIFNSLDYMEKPFGYVCYVFENYDIVEYSKTANLTNAVNSGLGGFIGMQYQQYLMDKLEKTYKTDALTGLYNRLAAHAAFEAIKEDPSRAGEPLNVIMADLDGLKVINDTLGHTAGDKAIASVAGAIRESCPEGSILVRFGGDEMLAYIPGECDCEGIIASIEEKLLKKSEKYGFKVSASCGYYRTTISADLDVDAAIREADEKMYEHKVKRKATGA